jgi:small subunit ribosomal protein S3Ae
MAAAKKKHWVPVLAPSVFKHEQIGESIVLETETLKGRGVSVNLMNILGDMKRQNLNVSFRITDIKEGKAHTRVTGITMQPSSVKRLVRRGRSKVDDSFLVKLKHNQVARIKPLLITKNVASNTSATALRKAARELITTLAAEYSFETLIQDIVSLKFQRHVRTELSRIVPLRSVDVRVFRLESRFALEPSNEHEPSLYAEVAETPSADDDAERS